jgi:hypothetical protein
MRILLFLILFLTPMFAAAQVSGGFDKRSFTDLRPIHLDLDGDGRPDTIQSRTFTRPHSSRASKQEDSPRQTHWITFDLHFATGASLLSFFTYRYGDDRADYWVWALKAAGDLDRDGRPDLVFYAGDDTTDETVVLLQRRTGFRASSIGILMCDLCSTDEDLNVVLPGKYDMDAGRQMPDRIIARWNPRRGYFEGDGLLWIRPNRVALREAPADTGRIIDWLHKNDAVATKQENGRPVIRGKWVKVETSLGTGWMERSRLATTSRWVRQ